MPALDDKLGQHRALWLPLPWLRRERQKYPLQLEDLQGCLWCMHPTSGKWSNGGHQASQRAEWPSPLGLELNALFRHSDGASISHLNPRSFLWPGGQALLSKNRKESSQKTENKAYRIPFPLKHLGSHMGPSGQSSCIFVEVFVNGGKKKLKAKSSPPHNTFLIW